MLAGKEGARLHRQFDRIGKAVPATTGFLAWIELRRYATTQYLVIDTSFVPDAWGDAVAQAQPGQIAPGTVAVTIEGTRHRSGVWNGQPVTSEHPVSFTVFVVCAPTYPTCHLLRLSQFDNPLR